MATYTAQQAATELGITATTVHYHVKRGNLPKRTDGSGRFYFTTKDLEKFIRNKTPQALATAASYKKETPAWQDNEKPADWTSPIAEAVTAPSLPVPDTFRAPTWIEMFRYHVNELAELHSKAANQGLTEHRLLTSNLMLYSHGVEINVKGTALQSAQPSQLPAQSAKQK